MGVGEGEGEATVGNFVGAAVALGEGVFAPHPESEPASPRIVKMENTRIKPDDLLILR
jgi:hypothetical protein